MVVRSIASWCWVPTCLALLGLASGCRPEDPSTDVGNSESADTEGTGDDSTGGELTVELDGAVQKGPFILGSTISIAPLDAAGNPTGESFGTQTINDRGEFSVTFDALGSVSLEGNGFYYNEATGALSAAPLTLRAVYVIEQAGPQSATINLFTHLAFNRIKQLLAQGMPYIDAVTQAEHELVLALDVGYDGFEPQAIGVELDLAGGDTDANAYLLAVSAVLAQAAVDAAGGPMGPVDARLQEIVNSIALDLADDGTIAASLVEQLAAARHVVDTDAVEAALAARFEEIAEAAPVPDMDRVLDQDDDGLHNNDDNCRLDVNPNQEDGDSDGIGDICDPCPEDADNLGGVGCACELGGPDCAPGLTCPALPYRGCGWICDPGACVPTSIVSLDAGAAHTCVLLSTGAVRCWGFNGGKLGYPNEPDLTSPASVGDVDTGGVYGAHRLVVGPHHACASDGDLRCWGLGFDGKLGYGNVDDIGDDEPPSAAGPVNFGSGWTPDLFGLGSYATCVTRLEYKHVVKCWGGELGDNEVPVSIPNFSLEAEVIGIDVGIAHACVLLAGGAVRCWGYGLEGQLGYPQPVFSTLVEGPPNASNVSLGGPAIQIATGHISSCALLEDGSVRCWGSGHAGELGYGNTQHVGDDELPSSVGPVQLGAPAVQISVGGWHACALLQGGDVRCWGEGESGKLGHGSTTNIGDDELPTAIPVIDIGGPAVQVSAGQLHTCALLENGSVRCWGEIIANGIESEPIGDDEPPSAGPLINVL